MDEIAQLEAQAIERTNIQDWEGARALFGQALTFEMPLLRRAEILRNVAGTYWKEGNLAKGNAAAQQALEILHTLPVKGPKARHLQNELLKYQFSIGKQTAVNRLWYLLVLAAGVYWGISTASGAPVSRWIVVLAPPLMCVWTALYSVRRLNTRAVVGSLSLYVFFLLGFGTGRALASVGIVRFLYPK
jgi:hypothetical protein